MNTKTCTRCGETKPVEEFGRDRSKRDGHAESFDVEAIVTDVHQAVGSWDFARMDNEQDEASYVDYWAIVARHQDDQLTPNDQDDEARPCDAVDQTM